MDEPPDAGGARIIRGRRAKLGLGAAAVALLIAGAFAAPPRRQVEPPAAVAEPAVPMLQAVTQREVFRGLRALQDTGRDALRYTVSLTPTRAAAEAPPPSRADIEAGDRSLPVLPGVLVSSTTILANVTALKDVGGALSVYGTAMTARLQRCDPESGLATFELSAAADFAPAPQRVEELAVGTEGIGVWRESGAPVLAPVLVSSLDQGRARVVLAELPAGAPIFDAGGRLALVAGPGGQAWTAPEALRRLESRGQAIPAFLGIALQPLTGDLARMLPGDGVLITDVEIGSPAAASGLVPGDVIVAIDDRVIATAGTERALGALVPGSPARVRIRRGGRTIETEVTPLGTCALPPPADRRGDGPAASTLFSADELAAAGVQGSAVVLSVDGGVPEAMRPRSRSPRLVRLQVPGQRPSFAVIGPP